CDSASARAERRSRVAPDAPLMRHHLVRLAEPAAMGSASTLAAPIEVDEQIIQQLLGQEALAGALAAVCTLERATDLTTLDEAAVLEPPMVERLTALVSR